MPAPRAIRLIGRLLRALAALALLATIGIGLPWMLIHYIGWPLPHHIPTVDEVRVRLTTPMDDQFLLDVVAILAWIIWAAFVRALLVSSIEAAIDWSETRRTGRPAKPRDSGGLIRPLAAILIGAIAGTVLLDTARAAAHHLTGTDHTAQPGPPPRPIAAVAEAPQHDKPPTSVTHASVAQTPCTVPGAATRVPAREPVVTITPITAHHAHASPDGRYEITEGDTLWDLAREHLGDPNRWREIYVANREVRQPDGYALVDPDELHVGWRLTIPEAGSGAHENIKRGHRSPVTGHRSRDRAPRPTGSAPRADPTTDDRAARPSSEGGINLASGAWVGTGLAVSLATAAIATNLYRRQRRRLTWPPKQPPPVEIPATLTEAVSAGSRALRDSPTPTGPSTSPCEPHVEALTCRGVALTGPGADAAIRGAIASAVASGTLANSDQHAHVFMPTAMLEHLLPDDTKPAGIDPDRTALAGERLHLGTDEAIVARFEQEMLYRQRILADYDMNDPTEAIDGKEMLDANGYGLCVLPADSDHTARAAAVLAAGIHLRLGVLLLGPTDTIPTVHVTTDGDTRSTVPKAATPERLPTLGAAELADALALIRAAHPSDQAEPDHPHADQHDPAIIQPPRTAEREPDAVVVDLRVLGVPGISVGDAPVAKIGDSRYALLAYLAAHPDGTTRDQVLDALYPDPAHASGRFRTACTEIRTALRESVGDCTQAFIVCERNRYRLDPARFSIDLWTMLSALNDASVTDDDNEALAALHTAVSHYGGDFADGLDYPWVAEHAATYRSYAVDALARIAEIQEPDNPDAAISALDQALTYDPVCEELYQRLMRIQGRIGRPDAVRRTLRRCMEALASINTEPSDTTTRLAHRQLHPQQSSSREGSGPSAAEPA